MLDPDHLVALKLQEQFRQEVEEETGSNLVYKRNRNPNLNSSKSLVDPSWELIDPTPDIYTLFTVFNERYFWGKLVSVCVSWSKKMTMCAGICSYQGRGGMCKITLSEPLLKLRPRKDLVETLLHEMIHAYLFVTNNNRDRDGHGPEFHKHMHRINAEAGTSITVYHDFHDEVRLYKQHWWRCNGICQKWKPYFGVVRRAVNRAPGPSDAWWSEHTKHCGGTFIKVKEPDNFKGRKSQKENIKPTVNPKNDIRKYMDNRQISKSGSSVSNQSSSIIVGFKDIQKKDISMAVKNPSKTIVISKETDSNQFGNNDNDVNRVVAIVKPFMNEGNSLISNKHNTTFIQQTKDDYSVVRNHWLQKFQTQNEPKKDSKVNENKKRTMSLNVPIEEKRLKIITPSLSILDMPISLFQPQNEPKKDSKVNNNNKRTLSLNVPIEEKNPKVVTPSLSVLDISNFHINSEDFVNCPVCQKNINNNIINEHLDSCLTENKNEEQDVCVICNTAVPKEALNSHVNNCLDSVSTNGKQNCDLCLSNHHTECLDNVFADDAELDSNVNTNSETKTCNICDEDVAEINFDQHIERCLHDIYNTSEPVNEAQNNKNNLKDNNCDMQDKDLKRCNKSENDNDNGKVACLVCGKPVIRSNLEIHLDECMDSSIFNKNDKSDVEEESECSVTDPIFNCPFCLKCVLESKMIDHLNLCFAVQ